MLTLPRVETPPDSPLSPLEASIVGHLLGRRQEAEHIARGLGQDLQTVSELCQHLHRLGLLHASEQAGRVLYSVR